MYLHSQSVLTLGFLVRRSRIWKLVKTRLCSFVGTGLYCLEKVTPGTEVFRMLANHHQSKVQSETSPTIYSLPTFKRITCTRYALEVNNFSVPRF